MSISCIENFSNEVFYEIFDHLYGYDVYKAFSHLNIRFDDLLKDGSFLMKIQFSSKTGFNDRYEQFLQSNRDHILSIQFSNERIIDKFIPISIINPTCNHLESLVLDRISAFKLVVLLFHCKSLPRLFSLSICLYDCYDNLGDIYQMTFSLPVLKYLKIEVSEHEDIDITIPMANDEQFSPLEYLVIDFCCIIDEITHLLSYTPQLSHLYCDNIVDSSGNINSKVLSKMPNLVHLNLVINDIDFDEFEQFLSSFYSQLKYLNVKIQGSDRNYLDGDRWKELISEKMISLTEFHFCYTDWIYNDFEIDPLINRFKSPFWIERRWIFRISFTNDEILFIIRPHREIWDDFQEHVNNSSLHSLSGTQIDLKDSLYLLHKNQFLLNKVNSLFKTIDVIRLDAEFKNIPADLFIQILNFLPNLDWIRISDLPSYEDIYKSHPNVKEMNTFLKNNKITKLTLTNISNVEQINLIIDFFPRLQYFALRSQSNIDLESLLRWTLLKIRENIIFHPMMLCIIGAEAEYDQVQKFQQMINSENLLKDYTIHRRMNKFYFQWT